MYDRTTGKGKCVVPDSCSTMGDCSQLDEMSVCKADDEGGKAKCVCR